MTDAPLISLLSDFGHRDPFVGIMKGVIARIAPRARVIDLCHLVPPQSILAGVVAWKQARPYFPGTTIHVGVVDPGVGGEREILAARFRESIVLAPDNGLIGGLVGSRDELDEVYWVRDPSFWLDAPSSTFHGRDIFAPVAAHLANGVRLAELGPRADEITLLRLPAVEFCDGALVGEIIDIDHFGNLTTNIPVEDVDKFVASASRGDLALVLGERDLGPIRRSYVDVAIGEPLALVGSAGLVEIAVRNGRADDSLGVSTGTRVRVLARQA